MFNRNIFLKSAIIIIFPVLFSCYTEKTKLYGSWESILIEHKSPFFNKTLPSSKRGEVLLTFNENSEYSWFNKSENLNLTGKFTSDGNTINFTIKNDVNTVKAEFKFNGDKLSIITEDGFTFTFVKSDL